MSRIEVQPADVRGIAFRIYVDDQGKFSAEARDEDHDLGYIAADSRSELIRKLQAATKRRQMKIDVPFTQVDRGVVRTGHATGLHARNRNVMVRWDDTGQSEQYAGYSYGRLLGGLDERELEVLRVLVKAEQNAQIALNAFKAEHEINLMAAVRKAVNELTSEGDGDNA